MKKGFLTITALLCASLSGAPALANDRFASEIRSKQADGLKAASGTARYIVVLDDDTLMDEWRRLQAQLTQDGERPTLPTRPSGRPDLGSDLARQQLQRIDARFEDFSETFEAEFGRALDPVHRYRVTINGFSARLSAEEARRLARMDGVRSVRPDEVFEMQTYAGPEWIGSARLWNGEGALPENRGEGVVIGVIDSGVNWDHPSFADPGDGGAGNNPEIYDHVNPYGRFLGLCAGANPVPQCNDKLVGVYDFVEDNPDTEFIEEFNNGADNGTHGAHTAGTAGGNPVSFELTPDTIVELSGVAPNANIISYRVCYSGDPDNPQACQFSAILRAIDQAVADGVDVINYSIGGGAFDPWVASDTLAYLEAVEAGIFVATSAGNDGPFEGTMGRPANAPWITAVGSATHDKVLAGLVEPESGGDTTPPGTLVGKTLTANGLQNAPIVYAGDFGNALCGTGSSEQTSAFQSCDDLTGLTSPFPAGTFNGEIVVCDRGNYGRIEKGNNLRLAGAGGYILVNVEGGVQTTVEDNHCLPSAHLRTEDGEALKAWLASGSDHRASLSGATVASDPFEADIMSDFSSRGPNPPPVENILKPNLIAPGDLIFAAGTEGNSVVGLGGTSMASPHVAGAAALLLSQNPSLTPMQVASMLELTATDEIATDENRGETSHFDTGAGRPRLFEAATSVLYLDETPANFRTADPRRGGEPKDLNLASLTDLSCTGVCNWTRRIGSLESGGTWTVTTSGFPEGVEVSVSPASFTLAAGATRELNISVDWSGAIDVRNSLVEGKVHLDNPNFPQATMPVTLFASIGEFPEEYTVSVLESQGSQVFPLDGVDTTPQVNFLSGGLQEPVRTVTPLIQDPSPSDPYDTDEGAVTLLIDVPPGSLYFRAETPISESNDVDLFIGYDTNGNGRAEESEELCASISPDDTELCEVLNPRGGSWWVRVQNWDDGSSASPGPEQDITLLSTVVTAAPDSSLVATGPGIFEVFEEARVRLAWRDLAAASGVFYGAVGIASGANTGADLGVIPVRVNRINVGAPTTTALIDGGERAFALGTRDAHESLFIDIPPGVESMEVRVAGATAVQNESLDLDIVRVPFSSAFDNAPRTVNPSVGTTVASNSGANGQGPSVTINGGLEPGRYYAVVRNESIDDVSVRVRTDLQFSGTPVDLFGGLWEPSSRPGINQGFEYTPAGGNRAFLWYTYESDGSPVWYIASGPEPVGNRWQADLFRFTNDGATQRGVVVGNIAISMLDASDAVMTWNLYGSSGSDRVTPLSRTCPDGGDVSYTGLWYRGTDGLGGASIIANRTSQAHIHYLYDAAGEPRWLLGAGTFGDVELPLSQFQGFPPNGTGTVTSATVGTIDVSYADNETGTWTLDYGFDRPARGDMLRTDDIVRLSNELGCVQ